MFCEKCGRQLKEGSKFCTGCGQPVALGSLEAESAETRTVRMLPTETNNTQREVFVKEKKRIPAWPFIAAGALLLAVAIALVLLFVLPLSTATSAEGLIAEAETLMTEGEYEEAILKYEAVLELEPKTVSAYIGIANAYLELGEPENAAETINSGLDAVDSDDREELQQKLDEVTLLIADVVDYDTVYREYVQNTLIPMYGAAQGGLDADYWDSIDYEDDRYYEEPLNMTEGILSAKIADMDGDGVPELILLLGEKTVIVGDDAFENLYLTMRMYTISGGTVSEIAHDGEYIEQEEVFKNGLEPAVIEQLWFGEFSYLSHVDLLTYDGRSYIYAYREDQHYSSAGSFMIWSVAEGNIHYELNAVYQPVADVSEATVSCTVAPQSVADRGFLTETDHYGTLYIEGTGDFESISWRRDDLYPDIESALAACLSPFGLRITLTESGCSKWPDDSSMPVNGANCSRLLDMGFWDWEDFTDFADWISGGASIPVSTDTAEWQGVYREFLTEKSTEFNSMYGCYIGMAFVDFDFDGVPELFVYYNEGGRSPQFGKSIFAITDGSVREINSDELVFECGENLYASEYGGNHALALYQNVDTGKKIYFASSSYGDQGLHSPGFKLVAADEVLSREELDSDAFSWSGMQLMNIGGNGNGDITFHESLYSEHYYQGDSFDSTADYYRADYVNVSSGDFSMFSDDFRKGYQMLEAVEFYQLDRDENHKPVLSAQEIDSLISTYDAYTG